MMADVGAQSSEATKAPVSALFLDITQRRNKLKPISVEKHKVFADEEEAEDPRQNRRLRVAELR